jgi:integrase
VKVFGNGSVERKGPNRFNLRVCVGYKNDGSPIRITRSAEVASVKLAKSRLRDWIQYLESPNVYFDFDTMSICERHHEEVKSGSSNSFSFDKETTTLSMLIQDYLNLLDETGSVRPNSVDGYSKLSNYVERNGLGSMLVVDITSIDIEIFCRKLKKSGGVNERPLCANTVIKVHTFVKAVLKRAVRLRLINFNPAIDACPFKSERPSVSILDETETLRFIHRVLVYPQKDKATALIINVCCGLRRGETCSLVWSDIDLEKKVIHLRQAVSEVSKKRGKGETLHFDDPKTVNGFRDIPIPDIAVTCLKEEKAAQRVRLEYFGYYSGEKTPVCANSRGGFMRPSNLSRFGKNFILDNGFDSSLTLHSLRHGFVTHLIDKNEPVNQVAQISGQTPKVALDRYGNHRSEIAIAHIASTLNEMFDEAV